MPTYCDEGAIVSGAGLQSVGSRISVCSRCETPLPICEALDSRFARVWTCSQCGTQFTGVLAKNYSIQELRAVRPEAIVFDPDSIQPVCPEMLEFARGISTHDRSNIEKRTATRHPIVAILTVMELDEQLRALGPPFQTISRNLSTGGICLINDRALAGDFLAIELKGAGGASIYTLAHVLRRRPIGPYQDIGTEFVTKFASSTIEEQVEE